MHPTEEKWDTVSRQNGSGDNDKQLYALLIHGDVEKTSKKKKFKEDFWFILKIKINCLGSTNVTKLQMKTEQQKIGNASFHINE